MARDESTAFERPRVFYTRYIYTMYIYCIHMHVYTCEKFVARFYAGHMKKQYGEISSNDGHLGSPKRYPLFEWDSVCSGSECFLPSFENQFLTVRLSMVTVLYVFARFRCFTVLFSAQVLWLTSLFTTIKKQKPLTVVRRYRRKEFKTDTRH